jgi:hypothetical protein
VRLIDCTYARDSESKKSLKEELVKARLWSDYIDCGGWGHVHNKYLESWLAIVPAEMVDAVVVAIKDRLLDKISDKYGPRYQEEDVPRRLRRLKVQIQGAHKTLTVAEQEDPLSSKARAKKRAKHRAATSLTVWSRFRMGKILNVAVMSAVKQRTFALNFGAAL